MFLEAGKPGNELLLWSLQKESALSTPWFWTSDLLNCKILSVYCLSLCLWSFVTEATGN